MEKQKSPKGATFISAGADKLAVATSDEQKEAARLFLIGTASVPVFVPDVIAFAQRVQMLALDLRGKP